MRELRCRACGRRPLATQQPTAFFSLIWGEGLYAVLETLCYGCWRKYDPERIDARIRSRRSRHLYLERR